MKNEISNVLNLIDNGETYKALQDAKLLYKKNSNNLDTVKLLAYTYIQIGNFERVIEVLKKSYDKNKDLRDFDYFNNMGYALSQIEEYEESISNLEIASKLKENSNVQTSLAEIYLKKRDFKKAKEMISAALDIVKKIGNGSFSKYVNVFLLVSEINGALKNDEETIFLFNKILEEKFLAYLVCSVVPFLAFSIFFADLVCSILSIFFIIYLIKIGFPFIY